MTEPMFSCQDDGCALDVSYTVDMLRLWEDQPICEGCYSDRPYKIDLDSRFEDLPKFVPEYQKIIIELLEALDTSETWLLRIWTELPDEEVIRPEYAKHVEKVRALLSKLGESTP